MAASDSSTQSTYEDIDNMAKFVLAKTTYRPTIGIICGSGLGGIGDAVEDKFCLNYEDIPGFPTITVKGHTGMFIFGMLGGKSVVLMKGRFHYYEGYPMWKVVIPVRLMVLLGLKTLLVTNASGGMNPDYKRGDLMIIKDHIDLPGITGDNVLRGRNDERFGPRFVATNAAYDQELRKKFKKVCLDHGVEKFVREGVYVMVSGPTYTSTAESRLLRMLGADAVGMSTVPEVIVARHCGLKVLGVSLITDTVDMDEDSTFQVSHEFVLETAKERASLLQELFVKFLKVME